MGRDVTEEALRSLHDDHWTSVRAFAFRATGDREAAEEIAQDTFVRAWQAAARFNPNKGSVRTWLLAIARNLVIDHHRREAVRPSRPVPDEQLDRPVVESDVDRVVVVAHIAAALRRLSPEHRDAIIAVHVEGATVREAAERLGVAEGTVKSRVYYGLRCLRIALEELGDVDERT